MSFKRAFKRRRNRSLSVPPVKTVSASPSSAPPAVLEQPPLLLFRRTLRGGLLPFRRTLRAPLLPFRRPPPVGLSPPAARQPRTSASPCARAPPPPRAAPTSAASRPARWTGAVDTADVPFFVRFRILRLRSRPTATGPRRRRSELNESFWSGFVKAKPPPARAPPRSLRRREGAPPRR